MCHLPIIYYNVIIKILEILYFCKKKKVLQLCVNISSSFYVCFKLALGADS